MHALQNRPLLPGLMPRTTDVLVVGAGPTGLACAAALTMRGVDTVVVDRQPAGDNTSRAAVVHARTLEVLEPLGVSDALVAAGVPAARFTIRDRDRVLVGIRFDQLPTRYPYALMVSQAVTEKVLGERLQALGGRVRRPSALRDLVADGSGVVARLDDGSRIRARYVVGADGMHSTVRERAGILFAGGTYEESFVLADVHASGGFPSDEVRLYFSRAGMVVVAPLPGGAHRIVATVDTAPEHPDRAFVQALLDARGPERSPVRIDSIVWSSRFRVHHRIASSYRSGRLLLAGDAAHVHSPAGGQGMNAGILDATALADGLVAALGGDEQALAHYEAVRRPIAERIITLADRLTRAATVRPVLRQPRNALLATLARLPPVQQRLAWQLSGLAYR